MLRFLSRKPPSIRVPLVNGQVDIQRVKIERDAKPLSHRLLIAFLVGYCISETITLVWPDRANVGSQTTNSGRDPARDSGRSADGGFQVERKAGFTNGSPPGVKNEETDSAEDNTIHLMLPIWFRRKRGRMYKPTDPEWKAFAELQGDRKRMNEVKVQVMKMFSKQLNQPPHAPNLRFIQFRQHMGGMLEIVPPVFTPDVFEVPCLFVSPGNTHFGWRTLPEKIGAKMERIFHPVIFANALGKACQVFSTSTVYITQARIADMWYGDKSTHLNIKMARKKTDTDISIETREDTRAEVARRPAGIAKLNEKEMQVFLPFLRGSYGDEVARQRYRNLVRSMTYQAAIEEAAVQFRVSWMTGQNAALQRTPQGACVIRGFIDCTGERGRYRMEISAIYLPAENQIVGRPKVLRSYVIPNFQKLSPSRTEGVAPSVVQKPATSQRPDIPPRPPSDGQASAKRDDGK